MRPRVLEIGCGTGFVLSALKAERRYELVGAEQHLDGLRFAKARLPDVEFVQLDARFLPYSDEFDAIGAFDVLEHIEDDEAVLHSAHAALKPGGLLFLTVPQHRWLWSAADHHAKHKRRYSRAELRTKLRSQGFEIRFCSSFVFTLLPMMYLSRTVMTSQHAANEACELIYEQLNLPAFVNGSLDILMRIDEALIAAGISLPAGGSLLMVAQRR